MARVYCSSLDLKDMHVDIFHSINVSGQLLLNICDHEAHDYSRDNVTHMKIRITIGAVFLATTFLATFLTILLGCYPIKKHWQINPDPGSRNLFLRTKKSRTHHDSRSLPTGRIEITSRCLNNLEHFN